MKHGIDLETPIGVMLTMAVVGAVLLLRLIWAITSGVITTAVTAAESHWPSLSGRE
jgi:hypothetical protein